MSYDNIVNTITKYRAYVDKLGAIYVSTIAAEVRYLNTLPEEDRETFRKRAKEMLGMRDKYFAQKGYGHHPCDQDKEEPVRIRPDGSRI